MTSTDLEPCVWRADVREPDEAESWAVRMFVDDDTRPRFVVWFDDFDAADGEVVARGLAAQINQPPP